MPSQHAKLSPSSASRWLSCTASAGLIATIPVKDTPSAAAREGTLAHELAEIRLLFSYDKISGEELDKRIIAWRDSCDAEGLSEDSISDMRRRIDGYLWQIAEYMQQYEGSEIEVEQRVDTGVPTSWGTADVIIHSPDVIHVVDLKYGRGRVEAEDNPQLKLYALGALDKFGDIMDPLKVRATIFQPRIGNTSTVEYTPDELREWREVEAIPRASEALTGENAVFAPSESACRFCPAAGICRARAEKSLEEDFGRKPDTLDNTELADILGKAAEIRSWLDAVESIAQRKMSDLCETVPGYKLVSTRGRRKITDQAGAIQILIDNGLHADQVAEFKTKSLSTLERLVGKEELNTLLGDMMETSGGRVFIAPDDDPREEFQG